MVNVSSPIGPSPRSSLAARSFDGDENPGAYAGMLFEVASESSALGMMSEIIVHVHPCCLYSVRRAIAYGENEIVASRYMKR